MQVVLRGGSWLYTAPDCRVTERAGAPPSAGMRTSAYGVCRYHEGRRLVRGVAMRYASRGCMTSPLRG